MNFFFKIVCYISLLASWGNKNFILLSAWVLLRLSNFGGASYWAHHARLKALELFFFAFLLNYLVLQYKILLISKLLSFFVTLVNLLGSRTLIFTRYIFLNCENSDSTFLHIVYILLVCSSLSSFHSPKWVLKNMLIYLLLTDMGRHASWLTLGDYLRDVYPLQNDFQPLISKSYGQGRAKQKQDWQYKNYNKLTNRIKINRNSQKRVLEDCYISAE